MESTDNLFEILDEIRKLKQVSISSLCQNIISERTYYRYLKSNRSIKFNVYNQLLKRLDANINDVIYFSFFIKKGDPGLTRFIFREHSKYYKDIHEVYESVKEYQSENKLLAMVFNVSLRRYEFDIGQFTRKKYYSFFKEILFELKDVKMPNIFATYVYSMFFIDFPNDIHTSDKSLSDIIAYVLSFNRGDSIIFALTTMDNILKFVTGKEIVDKQTYKKLTEKMLDSVNVFTIKFFLMRIYLYKAYQNKLENNIKQMNKYLLRHIANVITLLHDSYYDDAIAFVEKTFDIDAMEFFNQRFEELLI